MIFIEPGLSPATCHGPQFCYHKSFCDSRSPWRSFWWCRDKRIFLCLGFPLCRVRWKASMALSDWRCGFTLMSSLLSVLFCKGCLFSHNMIVRKCLSAGINIGCLRSLASTSLWIVSYPAECLSACRLGASVSSKIRSLYSARGWRTPWSVKNWCSSRVRYLLLKTAVFCPRILQRASLWIPSSNLFLPSSTRRKRSSKIF